MRESIPSVPDAPPKQVACKIASWEPLQTCLSSFSHPIGESNLACKKGIIHGYICIKEKLIDSNDNHYFVHGGISRLIFRWISTGEFFPIIFSIIPPRYILVLFTKYQIRF